MNIQPIGKGLNRITVKSERKRAALAKIPGVQIQDNRVYFPDSMTNLIKSTEKGKKQPVILPVQTSLFD